jgi:hypothetical protein
VLNDGKVVASFSGRRNSTGNFTSSSGVFLFNPATNAWQDVSAPGMYYWTKDVVVAPDDATQNTWYGCVFSGWGGPPNGLGGLYRTSNRGQAWTKLTDSQFDRVTSITFNPLNTKQVYLTTEQQGLWMTQDISVANPVFEQVNSYDYRQPERVFFNPYKPGEIWVSSFGNGIRTGTATATGLIEPEQTGTFEVFPNPGSNHVDIKLTSEGTLRLIDQSGKLLRTESVSAGVNNISLEGLPAGVYWLQVNGLYGKVVKE